MEVKFLKKINEIIFLKGNIEFTKSTFSDFREARYPISVAKLRKKIQNNESKYGSVTKKNAGHATRVLMQQW